ncbi:UDP-glucose dehydrogenase family protein [Gorillibacterium massiliense]|uniref:UDP-glucose dehydrogenase family protein n=1 Tax=Gorillibacterium massiliense TaxID=1280390 RepID=UPI0004BBA01E|nr:UDP-glucose/GDP-mannose dehydrogenase family protein [Gorillibacterium massiliense]
MKVTVMGTGYVGLTTGVSLAHLGHQVVCADIDERKIAKLSAGVAPFYEPGLEQMLEMVQEQLEFTTSIKEAVANAEVVFLAVGTPAYPDGSPNLEYLHEAFNQTVRSIKNKTEQTVIVNKSTVPVGTADEFAAIIASEGLADRVVMASNPEFLRQGRALTDTLYPDRIVVGGSEPAVQTLRRLYQPLIDQSFSEPPGMKRPKELAQVPFIAVDIRSAELAKYAANAFLAMKISFINEIANVCDLVGADVTRIARIIGEDPRIGPSFLQAGIGYGGSCFPKDTRALRYIADTNGYDFKLLSAVIEVNNAQKYRLIDKLKQELGALAGKKIAVLGLTFKPGTDDLRDAPSLTIIQELALQEAVVYAHDPVAMEIAKPHLPENVILDANLLNVLSQADAAVLLTEWPEYRTLDPEWLLHTMKRPLLIDGRNAYEESKRDDLEYRGIGLSNKKGEPVTL